MATEALGTGDGVTTAYTTSVAYINATVFAGRLGQQPGVDYTYTGTSLVFTLPPGVGDPLWIEGDTSVTSTAVATSARSYTSSELITSVQQRAFLAAAARDFGPSQILRLFNEEIDGYLVPFVAQRRLEYWVESQDISVSGGVATYPIPSVAMGGKIRAIAYIVGTLPFMLDQIDLPMAVATPQVPLTLQYPSRYYFMGSNIILFPSPSSGGTLRVYYYRRPSLLVLPSQCVQVASLPGGAATGYFRVGISGAMPSAYGVNVACDLVSNTPNFTLYGTGLTIHATDGSTYVEMPGTRPSSLAVGDWLCLYNTAPVVVGAPADLLNVLVQEVALKCAEAKGTTETVTRLAAGLRSAEASAGWTIQQRNDGAMRKVSAFPQDSLAWPYPWGGS